MKTSKVLEFLRMVIAGGMVGAAAFSVISLLGADKLVAFDLSSTGAVVGAVACAVSMCVWHSHD